MRPRYLIGFPANPGRFIRSSRFRLLRGLVRQRTITNSSPLLGGRAELSSDNTLLSEPNGGLPNLLSLRKAAQIECWHNIKAYQLSFSYSDEELPWLG